MINENKLNGETQSSVDKYPNEILEECINQVIIKDQETCSNKIIVDHLEGILKNLQRCLSKPEVRNEIFQDISILSFLSSHPDNNKNLIKIFQKKIAVLKSSKSNSNTNPNKNTMVDNPQINYFIIETLNEFDDNTNIKNIRYLLIISPRKRLIEFILLSNHLFLNFQNINLLLNNSKLSYLDSIFNIKIEFYIKEDVNHRRCTHYLDLLKLMNDANFQSERIILNLGKEILIENFNLKKHSLNSLSELNSLLLENNYHRNFIHTNNLKLMKNLLETEFNYSCNSNHLVQVNIFNN